MNAEQGPVRARRGVVRSDGVDLGANAARFSGFSDLYDEARPTPPMEIASILCSSARMTGRPRVVDLGSGTGLSTRWCAAWADSVIGVEPSDDMRERAETAGGGEGGVRYVRGWSHDTGLPEGDADVVVAVQALHWMDPTPTFAEVARLLRHGGVFAALDCDWPPSVGSVAAEDAWQRCRGTVGADEARLAAGLTGEALMAPLDVDPTLPDHFGRDPNKGRTMAVGVKAWSKDEHLGRMRASGRFHSCREVCALSIEHGDAERFIALLRSQGDLQTLVKQGLRDEQLGVDRFGSEVRDALGQARRPFWFTYRVRIGVT